MNYKFLIIIITIFLFIVTAAINKIPNITKKNEERTNIYNSIYWVFTFSVLYHSFYEFRQDYCKTSRSNCYKCLKWNRYQQAENVVKIFESVSILNLCLLSVLTMYAPHNEIIITEVSIGVSVFQFFVIILVSFIKAYCKTINNWKCLKRRDQQADGDVDTMYYERVEDDEINELGIYIDETNTVDT